MENIARAKGELVEALPPAGTAVLNLDDARVAAMAARTRATVLGYTAQAAGDSAAAGRVRAEGVELNQLTDEQFATISPRLTPEVRTVLNVPGALAARSARGGTAPSAVAVRALAAARQR